MLGFFFKLIMEDLNESIKYIFKKLLWYWFINS